jgi:hypothetical protein
LATNDGRFSGSHRGLFRAVERTTRSSIFGHIP